MNGSTTRDEQIFSEVLCDGETDEDGEAEDEFSPEAVYVAELKKAKSCRSCSQGPLLDLNHIYRKS